MTEVEETATSTVACRRRSSRRRRRCRRRQQFTLARTGKSFRQSKCGACSGGQHYR